MKAACGFFFKNIWTEKNQLLFSVVLTVEVSVKNSNDKRRRGVL